MGLDFGLRDPGLGYVLLGELQTIRSRFRLVIERNAHFIPDRLTLPPGLPSF